MPEATRTESHAMSGVPRRTSPAGTIHSIAFARRNATAHHASSSAPPPSPAAASRLAVTATAAPYALTMREPASATRTTPSRPQLDLGLLLSRWPPWPVEQSSEAAACGAPLEGETCCAAFHSSGLRSGTGSLTRAYILAVSRAPRTRFFKTL